MNVTAVVGTPGYMDPAYVQSHYATPSADVYRCVCHVAFECLLTAMVCIAYYGMHTNYACHAVNDVTIHLFSGYMC